MAAWMLPLNITGLQVINSEANYNGKSDPGLSGTGGFGWHLWVGVKNQL